MDKSGYGNGSCSEQEWLSAREKGNSAVNPLEDGRQCGKDGQVLLAQSLREGEKPGKAGSSKLGAKSSRDLVFEFGGFDGSLGTIVICGNVWIAHERKDPVFVLGEALLQSAFLRLDQRHRKRLL